MTKTSKPLPPALLAFVNILKSGKFTQKDLAKRTGLSPKSISNLISTVHNNPKYIQTGFRVERDKETGIRKYTILGGKPKAKKTETEPKVEAQPEVVT